MGSKRRLIGYLLLAATMIVSVIAMVTPVFTRINPGREYTVGNEFVYQLRQKDTQEDESDVVEDKDAAQKVADIMISRLETYQVEDYSVVVSGNDTIRVSVTTSDETELNYIRKYLAFSGGDYSIAGQNEETRITHDDVFKDVEAYIIHEQDIVPYVIIPVSNPDKIKTLVETVSPESGEPDEAESESDSQTPDVFLWANWEEGDTYEKAQSDKSVTGEKIILQFVAKNIWYANSAEEQTELQYLCGFADSDGNYDPTKLKQANQLAKYLCNMFNASAYDYEVVDLFLAQSVSGITYNNITSPATIESLLNLGTDVNINILATTVIGSIVALLIVALILFYFYHLSAVGMFANTLATTFLTYLLFINMKATFNVAAFFGGVLLVIASLIAELFYIHKFKEEVYKGRNFKKANQEATKKLNLVSLDITVIMMIIGLFSYFIGGNALRPMGILLFFGGVISLLMNLVVFRLLNYLLTNSTNLANNYKAFNIDESLVVKADDNKEVNEGPYAKSNFSIKKKPAFLAMIILFVATLAGSITFGVINGNALNVQTATQDNTEIYIVIEDDNPEISSVDEFTKIVIPNVLVNEKAVTYDEVELENREEYNYLTTITTKYTYFIVKIAGEAPTSGITYKVGDTVTSAETLEDAFSAVVLANTTLNNSDVEVSTKVSHELVNTPNQLFIMIATVVSIAAATLYLAFRYRPSRALMAGLISLTATTIGFGLLALARIPTYALTSFVMPMIAMYALLASIYYLASAKEAYLDEKDLSLENREKVSKKALNSTASAYFITAIIASLGLVMLFGFAHAKYSIAFASNILGILFFTIFFMILSVPMNNAFEKLFAKIHLPERKKKDNGKKKREKIKLQKKNSSEPEETIFIGIND